MISSTFYNKVNRTTELSRSGVKHYPIKEPSVTIEWYDYVIKYGENLHKIAEKIFGAGLGHLWTYIADNNPPRHPDEWREGDIIRLPKTIIRDTETQRTSEQL